MLLACLVSTSMFVLFVEAYKLFASLDIPSYEPAIGVGSLLGYLTGQLLNAWVMVAMKKATSGRFMWARMIASTLVGELADTIIFCADTKRVIA